MALIPTRIAPPKYPIPAAVQLVVFAATIMCFGGCGGSSADGNQGPLACPACHRISSSAPVPFGRFVVDGDTVVKNTGSAPAILDQAVVYGLHNHPVFFAGPADSGTVSVWYRKPLMVPGTRKLAGYRIPGHGRANLYVRIKPTQAGVDGYSGLSLYYHVGTKHYRAYYPFAARWCIRHSTTAAELTKKDCPAPPYPPLTRSDT